MPRELIFSATKKDFKIEWFSGTGPGGQHKNKHQNSCRIIHIPTGLKAVGQNHRDRSGNFKDAFKRLAERVISHYFSDEKERGTNEETIRTYHEPDNRVKDVASGVVMSYKEIVGKQDIGPMIEARKKAMLDK